MPGKEYDAIVIGGGHNGLVNACYLAKAGLKTLLVEQRKTVGGAAITEELIPGFRFTTFSYAISLLRPDIVRDLELVRHGLMILPLAKTFQPGFNGEYLLLGANADENYHEIARHSQEDAEGYKELSHLIARVCHALHPIMDSIPPNAASGDPADQIQMSALEDYLRRLPEDVRSMIDRFYQCSAAEILDDYIESDLVKAMIASSGIIGSRCSPSSKESGIVWLFHKLGEYDGHLGEWGFHKDGNGGFTQVLAKSFRAFGGELRTGTRVEAIQYDDAAIRGIKLQDGTEVTADVVVSALDPRQTFQRLMDESDLPTELVAALGKYQFQGTAAKVNFALSDVPQFPGLEGRKDIYAGFTNIGPSMEYLEAAFEDCLAGRFSKRPFLDCCVQSTIDPDLTPAGKHIMSCFVMYAPYHLAEGDWDQNREPLGNTVQATIEEFFPGFSSRVLHREVVTPLDIERTTGLTEGNIFAGELFSSQLFTHRPALGWNQYRTPIEGYYQCGSGTHPGGCVSGGPGKLAAQQILKDQRSVGAV
ncbi:MAG: phytoene desaturase family protein [Aureliella sp.]